MASIEDKYKKMTQIEHVLNKPNMYIGAITPDINNMWIFNDDINRFEQKDITFTSGFFKTYDELIMNAVDQTMRKLKVKCTEIKINVTNDSIEITNNGDGIDIEMHKEHKIYVPELVFGCLLTSTNYETTGKLVAGTNGIGCKTAVIYSKKFEIEIVDSQRKKKYHQIFLDNLSKIEPPTITDCKTEPYVKVTYYPDFAKFHMKHINSDVFQLLKKRAYDISTCTHSKVKIYFNDELIKTKSFTDFIKLHYNTNVDVIHEIVNEHWEIGVVFSKNGEKIDTSFVNGIWTYNNGTHVKYVENRITKLLTDYIKEKNKTKIHTPLIKEHLNIFVKCSIPDPAFTSQTKEMLATPSTQFEKDITISNDFITNLAKTGIVDLVISFSKMKEMASLSKTDGKKTKRVDIPKLEDAEWAGTAKSAETRLILTEGDSAKSFAIAGLEKMGRERYGVFPLRGKVLNVRKATPDKISKSKEFCELKDILGLKQNVKYTDTKKLRYGGIMILTDQDLDGAHIKGLLINMFHYFWPELLIKEGFIQCYSTPLLKAFPKKDVKRLEGKEFYNMQEYELWMKTVKKQDWVIKYYKGLGTFQEHEQKQAFENYKDKIISYVWEDEDVLGNKIKLEDDDTEEIKYSSKSAESIKLAFDDEKVTERKKWLSRYNPAVSLDGRLTKVEYSKFINEELIHFSNEDNIRSIPSIMDGLKPSTRKVLYIGLKHTSDIKVSQLAASVSEKTEYKHGEKSLEGAIIGLAQNFVGSNNINLLFPSGNFGYRKLGGHEAASSRYIYTRIEKIAKDIFLKEDEAILEHIVEEGIKIEPRTYYPIIPMVLVNGAEGIGTGYSTKIPPHNPLDICQNILDYLDGKELKDMDPWFSLFKGTIKKKKENMYEIIGKYTIKDDDTINISELPCAGLYCWTDKYIGMLRGEGESKNKKNPYEGIIKDVKSRCGNNKIDIDVIFEPYELQKLVKNGTIESFLKLTVNYNVSNLYLYNSEGLMTKYESSKEILGEFIEKRYTVYNERKQYNLAYYKYELDVIKYKIQFLQHNIDETIVLKNKEEEDIFKELEKLGYPKLAKSFKKENDEEESYSYLTEIKIFNLTKNNLKKLQQQYEERLMEYEKYKNTTIESLWKEELNKFITNYEKWLNEKEEYIRQVDGSNGKKSKRKTT